MATSGSFYSAFGTSSAYRIVLEWKRNSTDVSNNKSNVTVTAYLQSTGASYTINSSATKNGSMTINGTTYNFTFSASLNGNQKKQIYSKSVDIYHNSDGTKSFSMSVSAAIQITFGSGYIGTVSTSGTGALDAIPRTSSFTLSTTSATLGSTAVTVTISRASTAFTHKVYVVFGSNTTTYATAATTSASFTPAISLASIIPNATSGTATVYVQTLNGSTVIGTTSKTMTYNVPTSVVPTLTSLTSAVVASGAATSYGYVYGKSQAKITFNGAAGSYGSTIKSYKITGAGGTWTATSANVTTGVIKTAGSVTFTGTITDSRGRTSAAKTVTITVQSYSNPVINNYNAIRCTSDGTADDGGTYVKVFAQYSYTSLDSKNSATGKVEYKLSTATAWTNAGTVTSGNSIILSGINTSNTYNIRLTVSDNFATVSKVINIAPEYITLDFKAGGKGISIGKAATRDDFEVSVQANYNERVKMNKGGWIHTAVAGSGSTGYLKIASIQVLNTHVRQSVRMTIVQRGQYLPQTSTLDLHFSNSTTADATTCTLTSTGTINAVLHKPSNGVIDVYVQKGEAYDYIDVTGLDLGSYNANRLLINWTDEFVSSAPTGTVAWSKGDFFVPTHSAAVTREGRIGFWDTDNGKASYLYGWNDGRVGIFDGFNGRSVFVSVYNSGAPVHTWYGSMYPSTNNYHDLGSASQRWRTVYAVNAYNTSDANFKENISPIKRNNEETNEVVSTYNMRTLSLEDTEQPDEEFPNGERPEEEFPEGEEPSAEKENQQDISLQAMRDFIKNDCKLYKYNYKGQEKEEIGFLAQDIADTPIGKELLIETEDGYMYSIGTYLGILLGAIQQEFVTKDDENDAITQMMKSIRNS